MRAPIPDLNVPVWSGEREEKKINFCSFEFYVQFGKLSFLFTEYYSAGFDGDWTRFVACNFFEVNEIKFAPIKVSLALSWKVLAEKV